MAYLGGGFKYFLCKVLALAPFQLGSWIVAKCQSGMASSVQWGDSGPPPQWFVDPGKLVEGQLVSFTMDLITVDMERNMAIGLMFPGRSLVRVTGPFKWDEGSISLTVLDGCFQGCSEFPHFQFADEKQILSHKVMSRQSMYSMVETCCGMGIASYGFMDAGFEVVAANDVSEQMLGACTTLHPRIPTVHGDICHIGTIRRLHEAAPAAAVLAAGFSCQPFSPGGRLLGALDTRASTLPGVLRAALLLRKPVIILECVVRASTNKFVRAHLESFCSQCSYSISEVCLKLEDVWVSKRERWWCVLTVMAFGRFQLRGFPQDSYPSVVKDVMPRTMPMSDEDFEQISIEQDEHEEIMKYCDMGNMVLPRSGKCPTALHSWGSQVRPCPCGCRPSGFSANTLNARGIYGVFIPHDSQLTIGDSEHQQFRHLHPSELAILTGTPIPIAWPSMRLALCGLGQQASPLQAVWVAGQVHRMLDSFFGDLALFDYLDAFRALMKLVHHQAMDLFADTSESELEVIPIPGDASSIPELGSGLAFPAWVVRSHQGGPLTFTLNFEATCQHEIIALSHEHVTVGNLRAAEVHINPLVELWDFVDCSSGELLKNEHFIVGRSILVRPTVLSFPDDPDHDMGQDCSGAHGPSNQIVPGVEEISPTVAYVVEEGLEVSSDVPYDPLLSLNPAQLLEVSLPSVSSLPVVEALVSQAIPTATRRKLLSKQDTLWADDEIRWHLKDLIGRANQPGWVLLDPLLASAAIANNLVQVLTAWFNGFPTPPTGIVTCIVLEGHWVPLSWTWTSSLMVCRSWDIHRPCQPNLKLLHSALAMVVGARSWTTHVVHRMFSVDNSCGVCAVRFVDSILRGKMLPENCDDVATLHATGRQLFILSLDSVDVCSRPWIWGGGLDPQASKRLEELLVQHGVPMAMVSSRVALLCQAVGLAPLQKVLVSSNPWRGLKAIANQSRPPFQLVLQAELADVVKARAEAGGQTKKAKKGSGKGTPTVPVALDPAKVRLESGFFKNESGGPLKAIAVSQIGPFAEGVVLASFDMVEQFLVNGKVISQFPLAIVLINAGPECISTSLTWAQSRVPVISVLQMTIQCWFMHM